MTIRRYLDHDDAYQLRMLVEQLLRVRDVQFNAAEKLIELIATAMILPVNSERDDYVSLNSEVDYRKYGTNEIQTTKIVYPHEANDSSGCPIGPAPLAMAMLGHRVGSVVEVSHSSNELEFYEILQVRKLASDVLRPGIETDGQNIG